MKVEYINPIIQASKTVIKAMVGVEPERGGLTVRPDLFTTQQVSIICGVTGSIEGQIIYAMSMMTADRLASRMLGQTILTFDKLAASAIAQLGNMISSTSLTLLSEAGYEAVITPPTIIRGSSVKMSTLEIPALVIEMLIGELGTLEINISLRQKLPQAAAA